MIKIKKIREEDLYELWSIGFKEENPEWKKWDAPYLDDYQKMTYEEFISEENQWYFSGNHEAIFYKDKLIGTVSYHWENECTRWLEVGIAIYDEIYYGKGIGYEVLKNYITKMFNTFPELQHIGLTTWSGNFRMMRVSEKLGLQLEGRLRKVLFYNGIYYDSMKYGVLREEWKYFN